jgi:SAM-dependent methyltransferase
MRTGPQLWELAKQDDQFFPDGAHTALLDIEPGSYWFNHRNQVISAVIKQYPPAGPIFDIGGGNGYVSVALRDAGFDCVVIEPGSDGARNAIERGLPVIRAPFQKLRIPDQSIPSAGLFDVLEHIKEDRAALAALHRVLRPGGRLYIAVPAYNFLWSTEDVYAGHFRRYTVSGLVRRLRQAGFLIEYHTYFFSCLIVPIFLLRSVPARLGRKSDGNAGRGHTLPSSLAGNHIRRSLRRELNAIAPGRRRNFGASCIVVARKTQTDS